MFFSFFKPKPVKPLPPASITPEEVHALPAAYYLATPKKVSGRTILLLVLLVLLVGMAAGYWWWSGSQPAVENQLAVNEPSVESTEPTQESPTTVVSQPTVAAPETVESEPELTPETTATETPAETLTEPAVAPLAPDSDLDGLTDSEEQLFGTQVNRPDSDSDGYLDGQEVRSGYNPLAANNQLAAAGLAKNYQNSLYQYQLLYPASWRVKSIDTDGGQIIFQAGSGKEFLEAIVVEGVSLPLAEWYQRFVTQTSAQPAVSELNGWQKITSPDNLTVYLSRRGLSRVYILNYNLAGSAIESWPSVFALMVNSFTPLAE